ncbi:hypothetical protein FBU31_001030, partial [Coemansia sp. 'formosensis']
EPPPKPDIDTLVTQLSAELADAPIDSLRDLQTQLLTKCGAPEGLVPMAEVDEATARVTETHVEEMAQLKDILRKELAASEDRLKNAEAESEKTIADLRFQLANAPEASAEPSNVPSELTAERVGEIITAALAHKLELVSGDNEPAQAPQADAGQSVDAGGSSKKKGKKKRKGTGASTLASTAPSPAAPASVPAAAESDSVVVTPSEIAQLISLIETFAPSATADNSATVGEMEAQHAATIADLTSQLHRSDELQRASSTRITELMAEAQTNAMHIDELTVELRAAETKVAELTSELHSRTERVTELTSELGASTERVSELTVELGAKSVRADELTAKLHTTASNYERLAEDLRAAEAKAEALGDERAKLAQALAKAQGATVRLEAQQAKQSAQVTSLAADREQALKRNDDLRAAAERASADHAATTQRAAAAEGQVAQAQAAVAGLEEHVRAVDADLANSRAQFAEKSRALAQALATAQELQYALEKERRAARAASDDAHKQAAVAHERLAAAQAEADAVRAKHEEEAEGLRRRLAELDHSHAHASRADRLEAQHAERQAELETMRQNLQRAEDAQTALRVEADRLRDVERELQAANEHLARVSDERALSEQRWKRVHRDLKDELRRLHREKITAPAPPATSEDPPPSPSAPRSNSLTLASVSSLLRAATTANVSASAIAGRRAAAAARAPPPAPIAEVAEAPPSANHNHTRSVSNAASTSSSSSSSVASDALSNDSNANVNVEYLRNVLFRFFNDKDRRNQLVPVLSTLLRCKTDEIKNIQLLLQK